MNGPLRSWVLGVPTKIMVDNLKSAVLRRLAGVAPVFNPRYLDYAHHQGFKIVAESGVGYLRKKSLERD